MAQKKSGTKKAGSKKSAQKELVSFDYIKSGFFRTVYADGVIGGPTPRGGNIHMSIWSQRKPIPQQVVHAVSSEGVLEDEVERTERPGMVREVEVGVVLDEGTARAMIGWLERNIEALKEIRKRTEERDQ